MANTQRPQPTNHKNLLGQVEIQPGDLQKLSLGTYRHGTPEPVIMLAYEPDTPDAIACHATRLDRGNHYELIYCFQNYGQVTCRVTVREWTRRSYS